MAGQMPPATCGPRGAGPSACITWVSPGRPQPGDAACPRPERPPRDHGGRWSRPRSTPAGRRRGSGPPRPWAAPSPKARYAGDRASPVARAARATGPVRTALVGGQGVDLVHDDGLDRAQVFARRRAEHQVERLGRGHQSPSGGDLLLAPRPRSVSPVRTATRRQRSVRPSRSAAASSRRAGGAGCARCRRPGP